MRKFLLPVIFICSVLLPANVPAQSERPIKYRQWGMTGGYKEKATGPNKWQVVAGVNGRAPEGSAGRMALYRAAELSSSAGFGYFQIIRQKGEQVYFGLGPGPATHRGAGGAELDIIAVNDPAPPSTCLAERSELCVTLNAKETMQKLAPYFTFPGR